jgi:hypothetical protein
MLQQYFEKFYLFNMQLFSALDYFTIIFSIITFVLAKKLIHKTDVSGNLIDNYSYRVTILRTLNCVLFLCYIVSFLFNKHFSESWSQSYLIVVFGFLSSHLVNHFILEKYGDHVTVDEVTKFTDNHASKNLRVGFLIAVSFISLVSLLFVWDLKHFLENGSVPAIIGIILFATKEYWLEEVFASFTITSDPRFKRGHVIRIKENNTGKFYIILETKFIGTRLKELKTDVEIHIANSILVRDYVELYSIEDTIKVKKDEATSKKSKKEFKSFKQFIHFNIGYSSNHDTITHFFNKVMEESQKNCSAIGKTFNVNLNNNGDHAVVWELVYYVQNPFQILNAKNVINLEAFKQQIPCDVDLSTPLTHKKIDEGFRNA